MKIWIHAKTDTTSSTIKKALSTARSDGRKALKTWHKTGFDFDRVLKDMGYRPLDRTNMYVYYTPIKEYNGTTFEVAYAVIDFYRLVIGNGPNFLKVYAADPNTKEPVTDIKQIEDTYYY